MPLDSVTMRQLRNEGGKVIDRVQAGQALTVTRNGVPVAELWPISRKPLTPEQLVARYRRLPPMDYKRFRADVDALFDTRLFPE